MEKSFKMIVVAGLIMAGTCLTAQETQTIIIKKTNKYEYLASNPAACFGRGLMNIATCWTELPRCMIYDNAQVPVFGLIYGPIEGAGFTVYRALAGVYDLISLGFSDEGFYNGVFPEFFWQSRWVPSKDKSGDEETTTIIRQTTAPVSATPAKPETAQKTEEPAQPQAAK